MSAASVAKVGLAAWFFGNVYEGVVGLPELLAYARAERPPGVLTVGSPVRYFVPLGPAALVTTGICLVQDWRVGERRLSVAARATSVVGALAITGHLVRSINVPLLGNGKPLTDLERADLCRKWQKVNAVRVALVGAALALQPSG